MQDIVLHCEVDPRVDIRLEIELVEARIKVLEEKVSIMTQLNALGPSREYRTPEIHRGHLDEFTSKTNELKLLKGYVHLLYGLANEAQMLMVQIEPLY